VELTLNKRLVMIPFIDYNTFSESFIVAAYEEPHEVGIPVEFNVKVRSLEKKYVLTSSHLIMPARSERTSFFNHYEDSIRTIKDKGAQKSFVFDTDMVCNHNIANTDQNHYMFYSLQFHLNPSSTSQLDTLVLAMAVYPNKDGRMPVSETMYFKQPKAFNLAFENLIMLKQSGRENAMTILPPSPAVTINNDAEDERPEEGPNKKQKKIQKKKATPRKKPAPRPRKNTPKKVTRSTKSTASPDTEVIPEIVITESTPKNDIGAQAEPIVQQEKKDHASDFVPKLQPIAELDEGYGSMEDFRNMFFHHNQALYILYPEHGAFHYESYINPYGRFCN
ncbi:hypothetical protein ROZALSC1DRAFT_28474, partial [Rozella allomycis CSF55]